MSTVRTDEFRKDVVRIALASGFSGKQIADDLGVGISTLNKWIMAHGDKDDVGHRRVGRVRREQSPPDCLLILLTFFKTIKAELIWRRSWETRHQAETAIFQYINGFYNPRRRHSALGWKSPVTFERKAA